MSPEDAKVLEDAVSRERRLNWKKAISYVSNTADECRPKSIFTVMTQRQMRDSINKQEKESGYGLSSEGESYNVTPLLQENLRSLRILQGPDPRCIVQNEVGAVANALIPIIRLLVTMETHRQCSLMSFSIKSQGRA